MRQRWDDTATGTIGSDGTGTATITYTTRAGLPYLIITGTSVRTATGRSDPAKAYLYRDTIDGNLVGSTDRGGSSSSQGETILGAGGKIVAHWTGGTIGDTVTFYAEGYATNSLDG